MTSTCPRDPAPAYVAQFTGGRHTDAATGACSHAREGM